MDDKTSLETSISEAGLNTVQRLMYNWNINITTESTTCKKTSIWVILSLKCLGKELQSELVES